MTTTAIAGVYLRHRVPARFVKDRSTSPTFTPVTQLPKEPKRVKPPSSTVETSPVMPRKKRQRYVAEPTAVGRRPRADRDKDALEALLAELADLAAILLRGPRDPESNKHVGMSALALLDRARATSTADGWGDHTPGMDPPERAPRNDNGEPKPDEDKQGAGVVSDPTGNAAIAAMSGRANPDKQAAEQVARDVRNALDLLRDAVNTLQKHQPPTPADAKLLAGEPACKSCARLHRFEPVYEKAPNSELCRWCYDFWLTNHEIPKLEILELHHQGKRLTTTVMRQAGYKA